LQCDVEVFVHPHDVVVPDVLGAWPFHLPARTLVEMELERRRERDLDCSAVDFAVPLRGVAVAGIEERAVVEDRKIERRARDHVTEIDVAAPFGRWSRARG